jgi:hypothetical protein
LKQSTGNLAKIADDMFCGEKAGGLLVLYA